METVEVVVFIAVSIILGGLIIALITGWNVSRTVDMVRGLLIPNKHTGYEKVSVEDFPAMAFATWEACNEGQTSLNRTVYVTNETTLTAETLFAEYRRLNLCHSIQSAANNCGTREDVVMSPIQGPAVLTLACADGQLSIT